MGEQPVAWAPNEHRRRAVDESQFDELLEALGDLGELTARGERHDDLIGRAPAELFADLEGQRLGAFGVVRAQVHVDEGPVGVFGDQLDAEPIDVVVVALDAEHRAPEDRRHGDLGLLEIGRDDGHARPANGRGVGRDRRREVAGRRAGRRRESRVAGRSRAPPRPRGP